MIWAMLVQEALIRDNNGRWIIGFSSNIGFKITMVAKILGLEGWTQPSE
jgi:hypothetical protein